MGIVVLGANNPETVRTMLDHPMGGWPRFVGFLDRDHAKMPPAFGGYPILGGDEQIPKLVAAGHQFVNVVSGSTAARWRVGKAVIDAGGQLLNLIHPDTHRLSEFGIGNYIQADTLIQAGCVIGDNNAIHMTLLSHECVIGNSVFMGAARLAGKVTVDDGAYIGINATISNDIHIGAWSVIGAGAVVIRDVEPGAVMIGNPARVLRMNPVPPHSGAIR